MNKCYSIYKKGRCLTLKYQTKEELHNRALEAKGRKLKEIDITNRLINGKGGVGQAVEEGWFNHKMDNISAPDFPEAGVELKVTPYKRNKGNTYSAKERLVLNIIDYMTEVNKTFETSSFWNKNKLIELMHYEYIPNIEKEEYEITSAVLFQFPEDDLKIIRNDWKIINDYIKAGQAHELSESLTNYLSACTKGANSKTLRKQPYNNIPAKQRAYSLKSGYMTYILRTYILGEEESESIIKDKFDLEKQDLNQYILSKFKKYIGYKQSDLLELFKINMESAPNSRNSEIVKHILGLKKDINQAKEFQKANIQPKTIVAKRASGKNNEEFKMLPYKFSEIIEETWESSTLREYLQDTNFLLIVFEDIKGDQIFKGVKFWNMPAQDIEGPVRKVWEDTTRKIKEGVEITYTPHKRTTNFINSSYENIIFSKLDAPQTSYAKNNPNADKLPTKIKWINRPDDLKDEFSDYWMTKQSFWLNKKYMYEVSYDLINS